MIVSPCEWFALGQEMRPSPLAAELTLRINIEIDTNGVKRKRCSEPKPGRKDSCD